MQLRDKVCLITGGMSGIGAAVCRGLLTKQAHVVAVGRTRRPEKEELFQKEAERAGIRFAFLIADLSNPEECTRVAEEALDQFGSVDVLVHSAGAGCRGSVLDLDVESWMNTFAVHVHALFHLVRSIAPFMKRRHEGTIVLISSAAGQRGVAGAAAYGVAKGALPQFARILARELAPRIFA